MRRCKEICKHCFSFLNEINNIIIKIPHISYEPFHMYMVVGCDIQNPRTYPTWSWVASICQPLDNIMTLTGFAYVMYDSMQRVQHSTLVVKKQADFIEPKYRFIVVKHTTTKGTLKLTILCIKIPISRVHEITYHEVLSCSTLWVPKANFHVGFNIVLTNVVTTHDNFLPKNNHFLSN